jgi:hypothetical protein
VENISRGSAVCSVCTGSNSGVSLYEGGLSTISLLHMDDAHITPTYMQRRLLATAFLTFIHFYCTKNYWVPLFFFLEGKNFHHFHIFVLGRPQPSVCGP